MYADQNILFAFNAPFHYDNCSGFPIFPRHLAVEYDNLYTLTHKAYTFALVTSVPNSLPIPSA